MIACCFVTHKILKLNKLLFLVEAIILWISSGFCYFSLALEPLCPQVCVQQPAASLMWDKDVPTPVQLASSLLSVMCPILISKNENISLVHLIAEVHEHSVLPFIFMGIKFQGFVNGVFLWELELVGFEMLCTSTTASFILNGIQICGFS